MRILIGFMILVAGMAFGAITYFPQTTDREGMLAELTNIAAAPTGHLDFHDSTAPSATDRTFSPNQQLIASGVPSISAPERRIVAITENPPADRNAVDRRSADAESSTDKPWLTVVVPDPAAVPAGARLTSSKPGDDRTRYELVIGIQKELKRAGCYGGVLNGSWTESTRRAMSAFTERVNSSLPVKEPDYILHTLLKGHALTSCGGYCPKGQSITSDGRCVANAVIAHSTGKQSVQSETGAVAAAKPAAIGFTTTVSTAEADTSSPSPSAPAAQIAAAPALSGRMSIGGPAAPIPAANTDWRVKIIPTPTAAPVVIAPSEAMPQPFSTQPGSAEKVAVLRDLDTSETSIVDPAIGAPAPPSASVLSTPEPGLPGTKSGGAASRTANLSPVPVYRPEPSPTRVYAPNRPRPAAARQKSASASTPRARFGTRSVRSIFANPLGIH